MGDFPRGNLMLDTRVQLAVMVASLAIFYACVCRLRKTDSRVFLRVRNRYMIIGGGSLFSAFGYWVFPWYGGEAYGLCIFVGAVAIGFWLDKKDWDHGVPPSATQPGELYESKDQP